MPRKVYACLGVTLVLLTSCQQMHSTTEEEHNQPIRITRWTNNTELFVEFPPLVMSKETPLAVHLTDLHTFQPVSADILLTTLEERRNGHTLTVQTQAPGVPGIYRPVLRPDQPGTYRLVFQRLHAKTQEVLDTMVAGEVEVAATAEDLPHPEEQPHTDGIAFLKEQQWRIDFATAPVSPKELLATLKLYAEVRPTAAGEVHIIAPVGGRILAGEKGVPLLGQKVEPGEPLAVILPLRAATSHPELVSQVSTLQSELAAAAQELARVQDLYKDHIVPKRRLEQAQKDVAVLQARLAAARSQLALLETSQTLNVNALPSILERLRLHSPMAGTVVAVNMTPGALIEAGQDIFTVMDLEHVWIEGRVFESDIPRVQNVEQARFAAPALSTPLSLAAPHAHLVTIGSVIDPATRSVPLILEVKNFAEQLKIGMQGELFVPTGEVVRDLAIPRSAIVDDTGIPVAFVQKKGELFERRELELGMQSDGYVQVKTGLAAGERVVTQGAYRVYLASLSSELPAHGHAH